MNGLIEVKGSEIGCENISAVSARDLWKVLEVKTKFYDWINKRLRESDALQDVDFTRTQKKVLGKSGTYTYTSTDYFISLEVASHIALLERTEMGKKMRRHLLEVQKSYIRSLEQKQNGLKLLPNHSASQQTKDSETLATVAKRQHSVLMELVHSGIAKMTKEERLCYHYKLTDHGKSLGYKQNKNGTILPPK